MKIQQNLRRLCRLPPLFQRCEGREAVPRLAAVRGERCFYLSLLRVFLLAGSEFFARLRNRAVRPRTTRMTMAKPPARPEKRSVLLSPAGSEGFGAAEGCAFSAFTPPGVFGVCPSSVLADFSGPTPAGAFCAEGLAASAAASLLCAAEDGASPCTSGAGSAGLTESPCCASAGAFSPGCWTASGAGVLFSGAEGCASPCAAGDGMTSFPDFSLTEAFGSGCSAATDSPGCGEEKRP